jgi:hypothetical protein
MNAVMHVIETGRNSVPYVAIVEKRKQKGKDPLGGEGWFVSHIDSRNKNIT